MNGFIVASRTKDEMVNIQVNTRFLSGGVLHSVIPVINAPSKNTPAIKMRETID